MHRGRAAQELLGRAVIPTDYAECASIFSISRRVFYSDSVVRRMESALVSKWIWHRRWHHRACNQRCSAGWLHVWLSLAATSGWRISGSIFPRGNVLSRLRLRNLFQSPPHALGVAESVLGRFRRSLRAALRNG